MRQLRLLALLALCAASTACAGKSLTETGSGGGAAGESSTGNAGSGVVESGAACAPEGAQAALGCNQCSCGNGTWSCTHHTCPMKACGGRAGSTCDDNEYCAYAEGDLCGAADASASCQPRPNGCPKNLAPVCGCDGHPYGNACAAAAAGTGVYTSGSCNVRD